MNKINGTPISNNMVITANLVKRDSAIILNERPQFQAVQQVLAVGPRVEDVKVGDWIYMDVSRYMRHVKTKSEIKVGIGGQDMIKEEFVPPEFMAPGDDEIYFKITDREIEMIVNDYEALPEEMKDFYPVREYEDILEKERRASVKAKSAADKKVRDKVRPISKEINAPAIMAEGKFRG